VYAATAPTLLRLPRRSQNRKQVADAPCVTGDDKTTVFSKTHNPNK